MRRITKIVIEIDVDRLDSLILDVKQIKDVCIEYYNIGEDSNWLESVPFKVLYYETEDGKRFHVK